MQIKRLQDKSSNTFPDFNPANENEDYSILQNQDSLLGFETPKHQFEPLPKRGNLYSMSSKQFDRKLNKEIIQPKLTIGQPNDKYEQEADRMADLIVNQISSGSLNVKKKAKHLIIQQKRPDSQSTLRAPSSVAQKLEQKKGQGNFLPANVKTQMEQGFGADFSKVRVHTDGEAIQLNQELESQAFTYGADIFFSRGKYNPYSKEGKYLLVHELTHTIQQVPSRANIIQQKKDPNSSKLRKLTFEEEIEVGLAIVETFYKYSQLKINLPDNNGVATVRVSLLDRYKKKKQRPSRARENN